MSPRRASGQQPIEPQMVLIPGRSFLMGSPDGRENERPVHRVWADAFEMGIHQVTNGEFRCFVAATGHPAPPFRDDPHFHRSQQPVVGVSWFDAVAYCEWLSQMTDRVYRLPTEAQWERAARGDLDGKRYTWGNGPPESQPDYQLRWQDDGPEDVGLYSANSCGLYNIGDNVHEWCWDWYDAKYYQRSPERNPMGPPRGSRRSSRGGSWRHKIKISRCAARSSIPPTFRYSDYGFRLARST